MDRPQHRNYLRVRGEYRSFSSYRLMLTELPPRARRIPSTQVEAGPIVGTTSACAENTGHGAGFPHSAGNYLRVRGEYATILW